MDRISVVQEKLAKVCEKRILCRACKNAGELGDVPPTPQCCCGYASQYASLPTCGYCHKPKSAPRVCAACSVSFTA